MFREMHTLMDSSNNTTDNPIDEYTIHRSMAEKVMGGTVLCTIILMTVVGNILVVCSIFTHKPLKKVQNFLLVSLAVADMTVAIMVMPFHVIKFVTGQWPLGALMCQVWITLDIWLCTSSILNLCVIAFDRYLAINYPIKYANRRTLRFVLFMIAAAWVLSLLISVPPMLGWNDWTNMTQLADSCEYTTDPGFVVYSACGSFYLPFLVMAYFYVQIFITARKRLRSQKARGASLMNQMDSKPTTIAAICRPGYERAERKVETALKEEVINSSSSQNSASVKSLRATYERKTEQMKRRFLSERNKNESQPTQATEPMVEKTASNYFREKEKISVSKEKRAAKTLAIIMGVFVLCWSPFFMLYITAPFVNPVHIKIFEASNWLGYINSSLNPVIYTIFNMDFRQAFKVLLSRRCAISKGN